MRTPLVSIAALSAIGFALAAGIAPGELTSSEICGSCHRDIHRMWKASAHARSMESVSFLNGYEEAKARMGPTEARLCLSCHAPLAEATGDWALRQKITWEGVNCDVCHSLVGVDMSGRMPRMELALGPVKRGPVRDAESTAHEVAYSDLHEQAIACAPCHEFANEDGTPIMTTFSEWKGSTSAQRGDTCQTCHMGETRADIVDPRVRRVENAQVNLHEVPGGNSLDQLHKALSVSLKPRRAGDELLLDVGISNKGAGHAVPTGMPGRRIILVVSVEAGQESTFEEQRVYTKTFADAAGKPIRGACGLFSPGLRLESDTRIGADERRVESFRFPVPSTAVAYLTVKLHYEHAPTGADEDRVSRTFFSERRALIPEKEDADG